MKEVQTIFAQGKGYLLDKDVDLTIENQLLLNKLIFPVKINDFHPSRRKEYQLSRLLAAILYYELTGQVLFELLSDENRAPLWPENVCGSISHSSNYIFVAMAEKSHLRSMGIDIETRGRIKKEIRSHIQNEKDIQQHADLEELDLLTLIFSAKEALYKALFPLVSQFFGFDAASLTSINVNKGEFIISLNSELSSEFGPTKKAQFLGRFEFTSVNCLTVIEII